MLSDERQKLVRRKQKAEHKLGDGQTTVPEIDTSRITKDHHACMANIKSRGYLKEGGGRATHTYACTTEQRALLAGNPCGPSMSARVYSLIKRSKPSREETRSAATRRTTRTRPCSCRLPRKRATLRGSRPGETRRARTGQATAWTGEKGGSRGGGWGLRYRKHGRAFRAIPSGGHRALWTTLFAALRPTLVCM